MVVGIVLLLLGNWAGPCYYAYLLVLVTCWERMVNMAAGLVSEILILSGLLGVLLTVIILLEVAEAKSTVAKIDEP